MEIKTTPEAEDAIAELFYEAGAGGVAIESAADIDNLWGQPFVDYIDDSLLEREKGESIIRAYIPETEDVLDKVNEILQKISGLENYGLNIGAGEYKVLEVEDEDWKNSWKKYFVASHVTDDIVVVPHWDNYKLKEGEKIIHLDPGMAFGTGTHETTKLCADLLEEYVSPESVVVDVGTGSGILAIIAVLLGAKKVYAIDLDPAAVKTAKENILINKVEDRITLIEGNLIESINFKNQPNLVVANLLPEPIYSLIPSVSELLDHNDIIILSGIIRRALASVVDKLEEFSFNIVSINRMGEWYAVVGEKL